MKFFIKTVQKELIFLQILNILNTKVIPVQGNQPRGSFKTLQTGTFYLNSERPLWILQDQKDDLNTVSVQVQVQKPLKEKVKYDHLKPIYYRNRQQLPPPLNRQRTHRNFKNKAQKRTTAAYNTNKGLQLPRHYIPLKKNANGNPYSFTRRYQNSKFIQNMPVFDAVPGEEAYTQTRPIFIYTGNKGRMLLNTMMSEKQYPMQEPVAGQILYPPPTVLFKPKPLVETFRQKFNVTMIPFYAHEAIDPRFYTTNAPITAFKPSKKYKKSNNYKAFHSPEEVRSQPFPDYSEYHYQVEHTTNMPPILEKPYNNHRLSTEPISPSTTSLPHKKFEVTYDDGADKFQITYEDDTPTHLERPPEIETTTLTPVTYESYKFDQNYYAFPLYTMSKLIENNDITSTITTSTTAANRQSEKPLGAEDISVEQQRIEKYIDSALKEENENLRDKSNEDTWFILNSRYKGPLKTSVSNLHSSKYVQSSPNKLPEEFDFLKIKPATTATSFNKSKALLQPQMRSLYGEHINMIQGNNE